MSEWPSDSSASVMTAAVTPEPQLVTTGFERSMPASVTILRMAVRSLKWPFSEKAVAGRLRAPGMWPERMPARGSASSPVKRPAPRASAICFSPLSTMPRMAPSEVTRFSLKSGVKVAGSISGVPVSSDRPSRFQPSRPPSST
ncbi:hypothetical protein D3C80_1504430 [compost metagenome]